MSAGPRVRVRRDGPAEKPWRVMLRSAAADDLVGYYATMPEAVRTGITAARFVAAGIPWRAPEATL